MTRCAQDDLCLVSCIEKRTCLQQLTFSCYCATRQAVAMRCALKIQKIVRGRRTRKLLREGWSSEEDYVQSDSD